MVYSRRHKLGFELRVDGVTAPEYVHKPNRSTTIHYAGIATPSAALSLTVFSQSPHNLYKFEIEVDGIKYGFCKVEGEKRLRVNTILVNGKSATMRYAPSIWKADGEVNARDKEEEVGTVKVIFYKARKIKKEKNKEKGTKRRREDDSNAEDILEGMELVDLHVGEKKRFKTEMDVTSEIFERVRLTEGHEAKISVEFVFGKDDENDKGDEKITEASKGKAHKDTIIISDDEISKGEYKIKIKDEHEEITEGESSKVTTKDDHETHHSANDDSASRHIGVEEPAYQNLVPQPTIVEDKLDHVKEEPAYELRAITYQKPTLILTLCYRALSWLQYRGITLSTEEKRELKQSRRNKTIRHKDEVEVVEPSSDRVESKSTDEVIVLSDSEEESCQAGPSRPRNQEIYSKLDDVGESTGVTAGPNETTSPMDTSAASIPLSGLNLNPSISTIAPPPRSHRSKLTVFVHETLSVSSSAVSTLKIDIVTTTSVAQLLDFIREHAGVPKALVWKLYYEDNEGDFTPIKTDKRGMWEEVLERAAVVRAFPKEKKFIAFGLAPWFMMDRDGACTENHQSETSTIRCAQVQASIRKDPMS
ncbi:hypothetical protein BC936DRAFT_147376 [Jimgerdemannia flammicorona]|uniref:PB1 domain-containing protein n=1 Tax=Jimgerdemannia flammicorona TaxID=994334 RepID=A0A433D5I9_9FUNG|nr:hypothetical protein BC936DRAFT_147376 [Jimgerdemannia flammicorona]